MNHSWKSGLLGLTCKWYLTNSQYRLNSCKYCARWNLFKNLFEPSLSFPVTATGRVYQWELWCLAFKGVKTSVILDLSCRAHKETVLFIKVVVLYPVNNNFIYLLKNLLEDGLSKLLQRIKNRENYSNHLSFF